MQTLQNISTKELRDNLAEILERVAIGKEIFAVSKFGKKKALITPPTILDKRKKINFNNLSAFGLWSKRKDIGKSNSWVSKSRIKQSLRS